uniref:DNA mismatch repair protein MutS-like N-terminal domain-containing protein n=1 Tax=Tetradesmus obliquus TaxID=3088 RepID=A0A383WAI2_TETOB|eukprot:jgi/Sobl393_1/771/SZX73696.1
MTSRLFHRPGSALVRCLRGRWYGACCGSRIIPAASFRISSSSSSSSMHAVRSAASFCCASSFSSSSSSAARSSSSSDSSSNSGTEPVKAEWQITDEQELLYWQEVAAHLQKPEVQKSLAHMDLELRLGLPFTIHKPLKQPSGWAWMKRAKCRNPMAVALVKVGAFYEAAGIDALLLVEYAGLNFMGGPKPEALKVPRAGCPEGQLQEKLRILVQQQGLSVAVWEEQPSAVEYGQRSKDQKQRFFSQLVTPENPAYLHGYADSESDRDFNVPTLCGVSSSISGLSVYRLNRAAAAVEVFHGLTDDSLLGLVSADSSAPGVVYLHRPYSQLKQASTAYASDADVAQVALAKRLKAAGMRVKSYSGADPLAAFKQQVAQDLDMPAAALTTRPARDMGSWPGLLPLYLSTLLQLGLLSNRGIPGLVDYLVPDDAPRAVREALAALLSAPPPHEVAAATRQALRGMLCYQGALPGWQCGGVTPKKVAVVLQAGEAPEKFFQALAAALQPVVSSLDPATCPPALAAIVKAMWPLLLHTMPADPQQLTHSAVLAACQDALAAMSRVVAQLDAASSSSSRSSSSRGSAADVAMQPEEELVEAFAAQQERFRRVCDAAIQKEVDQVDDAYNALLAVIRDLLHTLKTAAGNNSKPAGKRAATQQLLLVPDTENSALWINLPTKELQELASKPLRIVSAQQQQQQQQQGRVQQLRKPLDRNGSVHKKQELRSCDELDAALNTYRSAVAAANAAATLALKELTKQLAGLPRSWQQQCSWATC